MTCRTLHILFREQLLGRVLRQLDRLRQICRAKGVTFEELNSDITVEDYKEVLTYENFYFLLFSLCCISQLLDEYRFEKVVLDSEGLIMKIYYDDVVIEFRCGFFKKRDLPLTIRGSGAGTSDKIYVETYLRSLSPVYVGRGTLECERYSFMSYSQFLATIRELFSSSVAELVHKIRRLYICFDELNRDIHRTLGKACREVLRAQTAFSMILDKKLNEEHSKLEQLVNILASLGREDIALNIVEEYASIPIVEFLLEHLPVIRHLDYMNIELRDDVISHRVGLYVIELTGTQTKIVVLYPSFFHTHLGDDFVHGIVGLLTDNYIFWIDEDGNIRKIYEIKKLSLGYRVATRINDHNLSKEVDELARHLAARLFKKLKTSLMEAVCESIYALRFLEMLFNRILT